MRCRREYLNPTGYGDGMLYEVEFDPPGRFAGDLGLCARRRW